MATVKEFYSNGIDNAVEGLLSRLTNEYRENYGLKQEDSNKVMREIYKFLSVLQLSIVNSKQNHSFPDKYMLYDCYIDFKEFMQSQEFQEVKELSKLGAIHVLTSHIIEVIEWICQFCDNLLEDVAADDWTAQVKNN